MSEAVTLPPEPVAEEEPHVPTRRLLLFEVGGTCFACDMESFREVVPSQMTTRLPGAPDNVCGLINLRGTIVTVIDGGVTLSKPPCARTGGLTLIVDYFDRWVGIGVDDVRDIHDVLIDQFLAPPEQESLAVGMIIGAVEIDGKRIIVLDIIAVIQEVIGQGR